MKAAIFATKVADLVNIATTENNRELLDEVGRDLEEYGWETLYGEGVGATRKRVGDRLTVVAKCEDEDLHVSVVVTRRPK